MKSAVIFFTFFASGLLAETLPGFSGCGEYLLKGVLVKNSIKEFPPVIYKVNAKSKSELQFTIKESADLSVISSYLDMPTEISAQIDKAMDGTKGEIRQITKLTLRRSNPLEPLSDSGIFLITPKNCRQ